MYWTCKVLCFVVGYCTEQKGVQSAFSMVQTIKMRMVKGKSKYIVRMP
jgi:hypothetical protein